MLACVLYKTTDIHMSPERKKNELNIDTVLPPVLYWSKGGVPMKIFLCVVGFILCAFGYAYLKAKEENDIIKRTADEIESRQNKEK